MTKRPQRRTVPGPDGNPMPVFSLEEVQFPDIPELYAATVQLALVGNDLVFTFSRPRAGVVDASEGPLIVGTQMPVCQITMSALSSAEFSLVLAETVAKYEEQNGPVVTEFLRGRKAAQ